MALVQRLKVASKNAAVQINIFQRSPMFRPSLAIAGAVLTISSLIVGSIAHTEASSGALEYRAQTEVAFANPPSMHATKSSHAAMAMPLAMEAAQGGAPMAGADFGSRSAAPVRGGKMKAGADAAGGSEAWRSAPKVDPVAPPDSRLLVKNGNVQLEVPRNTGGGVQAAMLTVESKVQALGGLVERSNAYSNDGEEQEWRHQVQLGRLGPNAERPPRSVQSGSVTVRVPAGHFDEFMRQLTSMGMPVISASHNVQDVTDQYVDTVARVNTQQAALKQLEAIMKQATRVQDMTAVQNRMMAVVEALERHKATQQRLEKQAAMSTVQVSLNLQAAPPQPPRPRDVPAWSPSNSIQRAINTLLVTAQGAVDAIVIAALVGLPMAAVTAVVLYVFVQGLSKALSYFAGDMGSAVSAVRSAAVDVATAAGGGRASSPSAGARQRTNANPRFD